MRHFSLHFSVKEMILVSRSIVIFMVSVTVNNKSGVCIMQMYRCTPGYTHTRRVLCTVPGITHVLGVGY